MPREHTEDEIARIAAKHAVKNGIVSARRLLQEAEGMLSASPMKAASLLSLAADYAEEVASALDFLAQPRPEEEAPVEDIDEE